MQDIKQTAYLAPLGCEQFLFDELSDITHVFGRLALAKGEAQQAYWAQNIWYNPKIISIKSISDAAKSLCSIQRNWWPYSYAHHRRLELIKERLPHISARPLNFLEKPKASPLGSFTLIDPQTMLVASACQSPMPNGEWHFNEDKINPPSRAYLKLWELFTRGRVYPKKMDICLDLGASPGGWTWVLSNVAQEVIAIDKSPLDERISTLHNVRYEAKNAFNINLSDYKDATWIFSDVICYPDKLFNFVTKLLEQFPDKRYVFTMKFQGIDHGDVVSRFAALPGKIIHLYHNKHELTWYKY